MAHGQRSGLAGPLRFSWLIMGKPARLPTQFPVCGPRRGPGRGMGGTVRGKPCLAAGTMTCRRSRRSSLRFDTGSTSSEPRRQPASLPP
ncbi:hypothetical protein HVPorG_04931 [Roseomonas mucosa]|nr:hypothetical protein HVPorG_04931 [Roseomonas mucosa]